MEGSGEALGRSFTRSLEILGRSMERSPGSICLPICSLAWLGSCLGCASFNHQLNEQHNRIIPAAARQGSGNP